MKICLLSREFPPETRWGGIGSYFWKIARALGKEHEVHVICETPGKERDFAQEGVFVHRTKNKILRLPIINFFFGKLVNDFCYSLQAHKKLKSLGDFDAIQAPEFRFEALVSSFDKNYKNKIITRICTPWEVYEFYNKGKVSLQTKIISLLEKWQTKRSRKIIFQSNFSKKIIQNNWNLPSDKFAVLHNPSEKLEVQKKKVEMGNYVLYFGRISKLKGVEVLLKAIPEVLERNPRLKMVFIGDDSDKILSRAGGKIREKIIYLGYLDREEILPWIENAKFIVMPSLYETCSNSCLEAMSLGKAVIATKKTGFEEQIEDGVSGFLVSPGSVSQLRDKILECLERKDLDRIGKNAKKRAGEFNLKTHVKELIKLYGVIKDG